MAHWKIEDLFLKCILFIENHKRLKSFKSLKNSLAYSQIKKRLPNSKSLVTKRLVAWQVKNLATSTSHVTKTHNGFLASLDVIWNRFDCVPRPYLKLLAKRVLVRAYIISRIFRAIRIHVKNNVCTQYPDIVQN